MTKNDSPTLVSLFAGGGGLDLGLEAAGFQTLFATDYDATSCQTLTENQRLPQLSSREFKKWFQERLSQRCYRRASEKDVSRLWDRLAARRKDTHHLQSAQVLHADARELSGQDILDRTGLRRGELALLAGGPPCQPFSRAGKREMVDVAEGQLFLEFVRLVEELRPRWFLFENVKGLLLNKSRVLEVICTSCGQATVPPFKDRLRYLAGTPPAVTCACGASTSNWTTRVEAGGALEIIQSEFRQTGYTCHATTLNAANFGVPQTRERLFIVGSRDNEPFAWPRPTHGRPNGSSASQHSLFPSQSALEWVGTHSALWPHGKHPDFGPLDPTTAVLWVKNVVRPHAEPVTWSLTRPAPTVGAHQAAKLAIAPYGVPEEQLRRQQWHTRGKRQGDTKPIHVDHAYLTDAELLRLQSFPDSWYLHGTRMERAFQVGNAVPPRLAHAVGSAILDSMDVPLTPYRPETQKGET